MSKDKNTPPEEFIKIYDDLISKLEDVERKGKTTPYTSLNGHMFSFLSKEGTMGLRLSSEDKEAFIKKFDGKLMEQHGRIMKDFVEVSKSQLKENQLMLDYLYKSYTYVSTLKSKPSKKK